MFLTTNFMRFIYCASVILIQLSITKWTIFLSFFSGAYRRMVPYILYLSFCIAPKFFLSVHVTSASLPPSLSHSLFLFPYTAEKTAGAKQCMDHLRSFFVSVLLSYLSSSCNVCLIAICIANPKTTSLSLNLFLIC